MEQDNKRDEFSNKLKADDVWKEFHCPKYVSCLCPSTDKLPKDIFCKDWKLDARSILQKLCDLISDPVTKTSTIRICRFLYEYLHKVGDNGYRVKNLPFVIIVIEFLAQNVSLVKEYEIHLYKMLELCSIPPLLEKPSEILTSCDIIEQYFTLLGNLLAILPTKQQRFKVRKALHSLLLNSKGKNCCAVKIEFCRKAMEKSKLPVIIVDLLQTASPDRYPKILELIFLLSSISSICSHRMLEANVLNTIFIRMDLPYAIQSRCTRPPDTLLIGNEYSDNTNLLILDTLWSLLKFVLCPNDISFNLEKYQKPSHCALWGLCYAFKRQVSYGRKRKFSIKIRNDIATIILMISVSFPSWNLINSGIADTVIKYLIGTESGKLRVFSTVIKFGKTNEDLQFVKILLLIVAQLAEFDACIYLMKQQKLMLTILQLVNPSTDKGEMPWSATQFWNLWTYAINVLYVLTLKMPLEFLEYDGSTRLYMLLEWCLSIKIDIKIIMACTKTICTIIRCDNKSLLQCLREHGIILLLIKVINYILKFEEITMEQQRILTLALMSIEKLMAKQLFYQEMYGDYSVAFTMKLLFRCFYQKGEEFLIDQRLLLAIGSYIWECITRCPKILEKFIEYGAIYMILDIIEITPYHCRCLFLAVLTDICENVFCGSFLCTWRGIDKKTKLMSLLVKLWKEEEIRIESKKNIDGTADDQQFLQTDNNKWLENNGAKVTRDVSPAMIGMIGSIKSKIYCICKILERHNEKYELAKKHYKMLHTDLAIEDRVTIPTIELYFTLLLSQAWMEVGKYLKQVGINLLGIDSQALSLMTQRYYLLASLTKEKEKRIIEYIKKEEDVEEKNEYAKIRDSRLILALDAIDELDYIYRTTDRKYMLRKKEKQIRQVNTALNFPHKSEGAQCHRTFQDNIAVTAVFNQRQTISSGLQSDINLSQMKLKVHHISPCDSYISDKMHLSEVSLPSLYSTCFPDIEKFTENE